ncbi:MAG TPA: hypothetical protein VIN59_02525 [Alphaproteobacteria bacterium]
MTTTGTEKTSVDLSISLGRAVQPQADLQTLFKDMPFITPIRLADDGKVLIINVPTARVAEVRKHARDHGCRAEISIPQNVTIVSGAVQPKGTLKLVP